LEEEKDPFAAPANLFPQQYLFDIKIKRTPAPQPLDIGFYKLSPVKQKIVKKVPCELASLLLP